MSGWVGNFIKVTSFSGKSKTGKARWVVICFCGKKFIADGYKLRKREIQSCGCITGDLIRYKVVKHGLSGTRFHNIWSNVKQRCTNKNPNSESFPKYYSRGIKCLWRSFEEFKDDMYESYLLHVKEFGEKETTIDRINNEGNYSKENCRWATLAQQAQNKRNTRLLTIFGETKSITEWQRVTGIDRRTIWMRIKSGWSVEEALTLEKNGRYKTP